MCGQWGEAGVTRKHSGEYVTEQLSLEELKHLVDDVAYFKPNITLFGGEPLLHPGCIEIIRYIKQKGLHCLMITNGSLINELADELVESGLDELNVSLDGKVTLHNEIRGKPGLFESIMSGLKKIRVCKEKTGRKKPFINLQCTITRYNYLFLEEMLDAAADAGAHSLTFHNLIFLDKNLIEEQAQFDRSLRCSSAAWGGFVAEPGIDPEVVYKKMQMILSGTHDFQVDFYPNFSYQALKEYYGNPKYKPVEYACRCLSPWIAGYVFPDGEVRPCLNCSYSFGTIKGNNFFTAWNSPAAVEYRRALKTNKIFPVCVRCTELYRY
jgi:MoaA/NifB/PqqE/SkfB family radical SAM enzyme